MYHCISNSRMMYTLRTTYTNNSIEGAKKYDKLIKEYLRAMMESYGDIDDETWDTTLKQIQLDRRVGGLGIKSATQHATAAYLTGFTAAKEVGSFYTDHQTINNAISQYNLQVNRKDQVNEESLKKLSQKQLSDRVTKKAYNDLENKFKPQEMTEDAEADLNRLRSLNYVGTSSYLTPIVHPGTRPTINNLVLDREEFHFALRRHLGLPLLKINDRLESNKKPTCKIRKKDGYLCNEYADSTGKARHLTDKCRSVYTARHLGLRDSIVNIAADLGITTRKDPDIFRRMDNRRPADWTQESLRGMQVFDATIITTHYDKIKKGIIRKETSKITKYKQVMGRLTPNARFYPFVMTTYGIVGNLAKPNMQDLVTRYRDTGVQQRMAHAKVYGYAIASMYKGMYATIRHWKQGS